MAPRGKGWKPGDPPSEQQLEDEAIAEDNAANPSPGRGRPRLDRKNSITLSFTDDEYSKLMLVAATDMKHVRVWARDALLEAAKKGST